MDTVNKKTRSKIMSAVRHSGTAPELALRKALSAKGLRYRVNYGKDRIDIAFPSKKVAVFVDGCFWHMCPKHRSIPASNKGYWVPKLKRNAERDMEKDAMLKKAGWCILRIWEHEIVTDSARCVSRINSIVRKG